MCSNCGETKFDIEDGHLTCTNCGADYTASEWSDAAEDYDA